MISKACKLPLEMQPVARNNNTIFTLKPGDQTFAVPCLTDNRSKIFFSNFLTLQVIKRFVYNFWKFNDKSSDKCNLQVETKYTAKHFWKILNQIYSNILTSLFLFFTKHCIFSMFATPGTWLI